MEADSVIAVTELLVNMLIGCFCFAILAWVLVAVETFIHDIKREKREVESAKREAERHEQCMKEYQK